MPKAKEVEAVAQSEPSVRARRTAPPKARVAETVVRKAPADPPAAKKAGARQTGRKVATGKRAGTKPAPGKARATADRTSNSPATRSVTRARVAETTAETENTRKPARIRGKGANAPAPSPVPVPKVEAPPPASIGSVSTPEVPTRVPSAPPSLPESYGEGRLLLLVRDPTTLFATWDIDRDLANNLKRRLGARAFAVSTLTLRLTASDGRARILHLGRRVRSRYLKVEGESSFVAEIGFTTPSGRFEFIARSAPCFLPRPAIAGGAEPASARPVFGYREARALARRGLLFSSLRQTILARSKSSKEERASTPSPPIQAPSAPRNEAAPAVRPAPLPPSARPTSLTARALGGASDRYRR